MNLPKFSATNSLGPAICSYFGASCLSASDNDSIAHPQFLGSIGEAIEEAAEGVAEGVEHVVEAVGGTFSSALTGITNLIDGFKNHGGPNGTPFVCGLWVTQILSCTGNSPTYSRPEVLLRCLGANVQGTAMCATVVLSLYPLLQQACNSGNSAQLQGLGTVCGGT